MFLLQDMVIKHEDISITYALKMNLKLISVMTIRNLTGFVVTKIQRMRINKYTN